MHPTRNPDDDGGRPVIRPSSTATSRWPRVDTIQVADGRPAFVAVSSKPQTVTLSTRTWKGLDLGAPFKDRSPNQPTDPAALVEAGAQRR